MEKYLKEFLDKKIGYRYNQPVLSIKNTISKERVVLCQK